MKHPPMAGADPAAMERLGRYAELLAGAGIQRGLLGPREAERIWERHIANCAALVPPLGEVIERRSKGSRRTLARICDIGSGAGLPGLVIAAIRPELPIVLLEPQRRRRQFLEEAVHVLGVDNVVICDERAEQHRPQRGYAVVTARAVAPLERLVPWVVPLLAPGGTLLALKGEGATEEIRAAKRTVRAEMLEKLQEWRVVEVQTGSTVTRIVAVERVGAANRVGDSPADG